MCNQLRSWLPRNYVIRSVESEPPSRYHEVMRGRYDTHYDPEWPVILLVRDYLNWAASWIKHEVNSGSAAVPEWIMKRADIWYAIVREALDDTQYIKNAIVVSYDSMTATQIYREQLCESLGGTYSESMLDQVTHQGEGSSFDLMRFQDRGSQMLVRERWRWFLGEEGEPYQCYLSMRPQILEYYMDNWELPESKLQLCESILTRV